MSDFTLAAYRDLLTALLDRGYESRSYADAEPQQQHLILRHDLDMSLEAALPIAETERGLGLRACYFVLVRTEMYNLFSARSHDLLRMLTGLGHEIGLHLDASLYGNDAAKLQKAAAMECGVLEAAATCSIRTISFHRPAKELLGCADTLAGRPHAYQPRFFSEMGYCSDSQGRWRYGHPLENDAVRRGRALQLLTHPFWWSGAGQGDVSRSFEDLISKRNEVFRRELAANCRPYREILEASK